MIELFGITPEEAESLLPSKRQTVLSNRLSWAFNYLFRAGLLERPSHGNYMITTKGRNVLVGSPERIDVKLLRQFPDFADFVDKPAIAKTSAPSEDGENPATDGQDINELEKAIPDTAPSSSGIPKFDRFLFPVLKAFAENDSGSVKSMLNPMATLFSLTPEQIAEPLPGGSKTRLSDRISWSVTYLNKAGLIGRVSRGTYRITPIGNMALAENPDDIDMAYLERFPSFRAFQANENLAGDEAGSERKGGCSATVREESTLTPDERLDIAANELQASAISELTDEIRKSSPTAFGNLIIEVMRGLKYSEKGDIRQTTKNGDGGIGGIMTEDALGLDQIYLQAKCCTDKPVGRPELQAFAGAMDSKNITKGVFVTSSRFTMEARDFAHTSPKHIRLIDGKELVALMFQHGIGVRTHRIVDVKRIAPDFFRDLED
jgi:restriction system protein